LQQLRVIDSINSLGAPPLPLNRQAFISPLPGRKFASLGEEVGLTVGEWQRTGDLQ